ncbi:hypothetical protein JKG47_13190 [Acidithiobacillus sp. MC6.1]|nr:hypothetical protein [Acidithiobacillus sp. MC6.1]
MDTRLENALRNDFPALYGEHPDLRFWCRDGWYLLLCALSEQVQGYCHETGMALSVHEVKQKLGTLRYYYGYRSAMTDRQRRDLRNIIQDFYDRSARVCEDCGAPGTLLVSGGYWHVACADHADGGVPPEVFQRLLNKHRESMGIPSGRLFPQRDLPVKPGEDETLNLRYVAIRMDNHAEELAEARSLCHAAAADAPVLHYLVGSVGAGKTLLSATLRRDLGIAETEWIDVDRHLASLPEDYASLLPVAKEAIRQWLPHEAEDALPLGLIPSANDPLPHLQVAYLLSNADWRRGVDARKSGLLETTFALPGRFDQALETIEAGMVVDLDYVGVHDLDTLVRRVQSRAQRGERADIPEDQVSRNLLNGFLHTALVARIARRVRIYDNRTEMDLTMHPDYQPPLLIELEKGVVLRQTVNTLPWWAVILADAAMGRKMPVDIEALTR